MSQCLKMHVKTKKIGGYYGKIKLKIQCYESRRNRTS